jgi:Domain of unknown function (DUF4440)
MSAGGKTIARMVVVLVLASFAMAGGQRQRTQNHPVTRTRLVALYSDLEGQLATAAEKADTARLQQLLADDFEQWSPEPPGDPILREDWIAAYHPASVSTHQMAVRTFGDTEIASFVLHQKGAFADKDASGEFFVVDVWRREGNTSRLASRYISKSPKIGVQSAPPAKH